MNYDNLTKKQKAFGAHYPLPLDIEERLYQWLRIELTYTSNAIEGSSLSRRETERVLTEKQRLRYAKGQLNIFEATNHAAAFDWVYARAARKDNITEHDILAIHNHILANIDDTHAGCYRSSRVRIGGSVVIFPNPLRVPDHMMTLIAWYEEQKTKLHPVQLAADMHYRLVKIHPFIDGNGRTSRLLMNLILMQQGYPCAIITPDESEEYLAVLEHVHATDELVKFEEFIARVVDRSFDEYEARIISA